MSLAKFTIKEAHEKLKKREISSVELTQVVFDEIKKKDDKISAFLTLTPELALEQAKKVDERISFGENIYPLSGIPVAVKDNMLVEGVRCTSASKILENYISSYDATVVKTLKKLGAVIIGKTNLDEFAMGSSTENSAFGPTKNPVDLERVPGGSSGGSAAAVKADECIYALGSDTGGSIRQPAGFCGVVGLKPTYGAVSRYGLMAMASSLDQIGPFTKTVEDAAYVFEAISGSDKKDATSQSPRASFKAEDIVNGNFDLKKLRIGIPKECFVEGLDKEVENEVRGAIEKFKENGAEVKEVSLPRSRYALACYYIIMPAEVCANLARFDGIKYGYSRAEKDLLETYLATRQHGFGREVRRRIMLGTYVLSAGYYDAYYLKAQKVRALIKQDFENVFKEVDVLMTPTSPTVPFKFGEKTEDPLSMYLADIYTVPVNLAGVPAVSIPCKNSPLPVGLQIIGRHFDEKTVLQTALAYDTF